MIRYLCILCFCIGCYSVSRGQPIAHYTPAQKRLLALSAVHIMNIITVHALDEDSIMAIARQVNGLPFLTTYTEVLDDRPSPGTGLINAGRIAQASELAQTLQGEDQIRLLLELSIWYLHQPGTHAKDLDSAGHYLHTAAQLSGSSRNTHWQNTCALIQAELYRQGGNPDEGKKTLLHLCAATDREDDIRTTAIASRQLGTYLSYNDSIRLHYYNASLDLYHRLGSREGEIDLLWDLADLQRNRDMQLTKKYMLRVLDLQQSIGFKHTLYSQYLLSYSYLATVDYLTALETAYAALENMKWAGLTSLQGLFYTRLGATYWTLGKEEEAVAWFKKSLESRTRETRIFWYKSLIFVTTLLPAMGRAAEALDLIQRITGEYPPLTIWEQIQIFSLKGLCYEKLNNYPLADENYMSFLELSNKFPKADPNAELMGTYIETARFYLSCHQVKKARLFINKAFSYQNPTADSNLDIRTLLYQWYYKLDSAEGNYRSALRNHILYKYYYDSSLSIGQSRKLDELNVRYATEKKDHDILLLKEQANVHQGQLQRQKLVRNITLGGIAGLLLMITLLFIQYRSKQRINKEVLKKNETLKRLVDEKEWLLKEVHHRVKNNLQTIVSLLELQPDASHHGFPAIRDSRNRIYAMSLIHQKLYQTGNITTVNMGAYIRELVSHLQDAYNAPGNIRFQLDIDPVNLDVSQAVPVGLIVNEAVTNSIKYAFYTAGDHPVITVSLKTGPPGRMELTIADNGRGLPADNGNNGEGGLGFKLMRGLAEDIDGQLFTVSARGARISIKFPASTPLNNISMASSTQKTVNV